ncbi:MAG TPA: hypothetical protein VFF16_15185 [Telluria sp.]|nr:hypothetical protein [Telluria sp.]
MPKPNLTSPLREDPSPDAPETNVPRCEEDARVQALVKEALETGPGNVYDTPDDFLRAVRARVRR